MRIKKRRKDDDFMKKFTELELLGINEKEEDNEQIVQKFKDTVEKNERKVEIKVNIVQKEIIKSKIRAVTAEKYRRGVWKQTQLGSCE